jgi:NAD(P)-dependent dehydrogenase (short-subunit alcohol dehydrogenase family)
LTSDGERQLKAEVDRLGLPEGIVNALFCISLLSGKLMPVPLDVTSDESVQKAADFVAKNLPEDQKLWALINNAGVLR